ncbi:EIN3-binding F-box protein 1 [Punica granatum]|uniref:EIN3-binding F-box protein 1 n=1 Tax=Punica granatum TaxID=22663 RepID=A0A6P8BQU6_PUNGR|nr:EIN3-binding F-box protein 1 [Punica granatum]
MSKVYGFPGKRDFFRGDSICSNPKEPSLFLSLGRRVDVYFPPNKKSRVSAPIVFRENLVEPKVVSVEVLPDECLFEILRRLPGNQERSACACVSKRWLNLLSNIRRDELNADEVVLRTVGETVKEEEKEETQTESESDGYLSRILEGKKATDTRLAAISVGTAARGGLGKLLVRGSNTTRGVTDIGLRAVARGCPNLQVLSLWNVPCIGDEGLVEIAKGCPHLEKLDIRHCHSITDRCLVALAKGCPNLTEVTIESCRKVSNEGLQTLAKCCLNLKSVSVKDCPLVGDQGIAGLVSNASFVLTKLKLQGLNVTDLSLAVIGHYGKQVTELVLENLSNVSERGFWVMGNGHGLQKLRSLSVSSCQGVTDLGFDSIAKGCPNLKQLSVRRCSVLSDNGLVSFAKSAVSLEKLHLEECHRVTQYGLFGSIISSRETLKTLSVVNCFGVKDFDSSPPVVPSCESLRSLSIKNCPGFGDSNLVILGKICPRLQNLDLSGLCGITDSGLLPLSESCEDGLTRVNISGCVNLTDEAVTALCRNHGWGLEVLNLDSCPKIGDRSLGAISENCQLLNDLDVSNSAVSDLGMAALSRGDHLNLQILSVAGCHISDKSLPALKKLGKSLVGLNLQHCNGISRRSVNRLVEQLWKCDILY